MRPQKSLKIDLSKEYPCPCRRRGRLLPITLTEAFGCDRCQQIFVVDEKNQIIEQLSTNYPGKRAWRWTGYRWITAHYGIADGGLPLMAVVVILVVMIIGLAFALRSLPDIGMMAAFLILLVVSLLGVFMYWFANRH